MKSLTSATSVGLGTRLARKRSREILTLLAIGAPVGYPNFLRKKGKQLGLECPAVNGLEAISLRKQAFNEK